MALSLPPSQSPCRSTPLVSEPPTNSFVVSPLSQAEGTRALCKGLFPVIRESHGLCGVALER